MSSEKWIKHRCCCKEQCFAKVGDGCSILNETPQPGKKCSFRKADREWTDGKYYPYIPCDSYGRRSS